MNERCAFVRFCAFQRQIIAEVFVFSFFSEQKRLSYTFIKPIRQIERRPVPNCNFNQRTFYAPIGALSERKWNPLVLRLS